MTSTTMPHAADTAAPAGTMPSVSGTPHAAAPGQARSRRGLAILAALVVVALGVVAYLLLSGGDDSKKVGNGPAEVSTEQLRSFAADQKAPVYWAGTTTGFKLELTKSRRGNVYVRYLPENVGVGDRRPIFTTIGSYPMSNAFAVAEKSARQKGMTKQDVPGGGIAVLRKGGAKSVYLAYPGSNVLVEVYAAKPEDARRLALSGRVGPVR